MKLFLEDGTQVDGHSFGADAPMAGEVVFTTGMTGYLEILTDPSYFGQIVVFTFPLIGNYGVFDAKEFTAAVDAVYESSRVWVKGVLLSETAEKFSHELGETSFASWLKREGIPALSGVDTRLLTQKLREHGVLRGAIADAPPTSFEDPLAGRYVPEVSPKGVTILEPETPTGKTIAFIDCGAKNGIFRSFLRRGVRIVRLPFNVNPYETEYDFDGVFFSNGPGDPETMTETIATMSDCLTKEKPVFGICLGCQIMALGAGGATKKMKYGHRGVNQPVQEKTTQKCLITTQNHGFEVDGNSLPDGFEVSFTNLNDGTVEGIRHKEKPFFSVQFHPEACAGPEDAQYLFDAFIDTL